MDYWKISTELVKRVAKNARLHLSEEEVAKFTRQASDVLSAFKALDEVDVADVEPSFHPQEIKNVWREDIPRKWEWDPLYASRHKEKKQFKGPRIV